VLISNNEEYKHSRNKKNVKLSFPYNVLTGVKTSIINFFFVAGEYYTTDTTPVSCAVTTISPYVFNLYNVLLIDTKFLFWIALYLLCIKIKRV